MSIRQRITFLLLAIGFIPMILVLILFFYSLNQANRLAVTDARLALEQAGEQVIRDKAETVAKTLHVYLESYPEINPTDHETIESDPAFAALAIQSVGETGYTAVHDANAINHFHVDPSQHERDMHELADRLPQFWAIFEKSLDGTVSAGYYDWLEPDGVTVRQKYMVIAPVEGTDYRVAATTYIDEFSAPVHTLADNLEAVANRSILVAVIISLSIAVLAVFAAIFFGRRFTSPIEALTSAVEQIQQGSFDTLITVRSQDEIGKLGNAFNSMASQLRESISGLEQRVAARTQALATVAEVGTTASTVLETDKLLQTVVELTKERFGLYHSHIYLLDEFGENLVLAAGAGEPGRIMAAEKRSIPLSRERSLVARAARERQGVTVNDVTQEPDFLPNPLLPDTHAELAVPMLVGADLVGVFDIQSEQIGRFTESDITIQTTLAAQIAVAVQNARQHDQTQSALAQTEKLFQASSRMTQAQDLQELVEFVVKTIDIPAVNRVVLAAFNYDLDNKINSLDIIANWWDGTGHEVTPVGTHYPREVIRAMTLFVSPTPVFFNDTSADPRVDVTTAQLVQRLNLRAVAILPLYIGTRQIGALILEAEVPHHFTAEETRLFTALAPQAATMLENRRQFERTQKQAESESLVNAITQRIQSAASVEDALQVTARELGRALGMKRTLATLQTEIVVGQQEN